MDVKANVGSLIHAIATEEIAQFTGQIADDLRQQVTMLLELFAGDDPTPSQSLDLENALQDHLREFGRKLTRGEEDTGTEHLVGSRRRVVRGSHRV